MITTTRRAFTRLGVLLPAVSLLPRAAGAADAPVRIGCPYPLSGGAASAGQASRAAIEVAVDIINNPHPELAELPLAATAGLPGLGGRKVEAVFADHQGNPATAQSEALRLITQDHVAALCGCYQSSCTLTASAVAERYGIPVHGAGIRRAQPDRARLQMVLPHHAGRHRFRRRLCRLPQRVEDAREPRSIRSRW